MMRPARRNDFDRREPIRAFLSSIIALAATFTVILLIGCTPEDDPPPPPDYPSLFDRHFGLQVSIEPSTLTNGTPNIITFAARPRYSGTGFFTLEGSEGYGRVTSPVTAEFGSINYRVDWVAGHTTTLAWTAEFVNSPHQTVIAAVAWMDSLDIDGIRYHADAPEVQIQIGRDILGELYREITIERMD